MNFNPFVFSYKYYPNSKLATMVNCICASLQRMFILFAVMIALLFILGVIWGSNGSSFEVFIIPAGLFFLWFFLKKNKDKWSDKIAAKQESIDNPKNEKI